MTHDHILVMTVSSDAVCYTTEKSEEKRGRKERERMKGVKQREGERAPKRKEERRKRGRNDFDIHLSINIFTQNFVLHS